MLLELKVRNWASFKDESVLNTLATTEEQHPDHLSAVPAIENKALPLALLYGGNASGKTNLIKALAFLQSLVRRGIDVYGKVNAPIEVNPFILDDEHRVKPSMIYVTFLSNGHVYEYSVEVGSVVFSEKLSIVFKNESHLIFSRQQESVIIGDIKDCQFYGQLDDQHDDQLYGQLEELSKFVDCINIRPTQLFLNLVQSMALKVKPLQDTFEWFVSLICVFPNQMLSQFVYEESSEFDRVLSGLNTGVIQVKFYPIEPNDELKHLASKASLTTPISLVMQDARFSCKYTDEGQLQFKKLYTLHKGHQGKDYFFDYELESNGTKQVLDLVHAIMALTKEGSKLVLVVDEFDRSLHPLISKQLIRMFLDGRKPNAITQLIATCHNPLLLDQNLLRRDEFWLLERNQEGASSIFRLSDVNDVDDSTDLQKLYFEGNLGGVPTFF